MMCPSFHQLTEVCQLNMKKHCLKMHKTPVFLDVHLYIYLQGSRRWFFSLAAKSSSG